VVGLERIDHQHGRAVLGYWIAPEHRGNGYATEASELLVDHGVSHERLHGIEASVYEHNPTSARVLEKVGFTGERVLRDQQVRRRGVPRRQAVRSAGPGVIELTPTPGAGGCRPLLARGHQPERVSVIEHGGGLAG